MLRRNFLKTILGLPLLTIGTQPKAQAAPSPRPTLLLETPVAGFQYYEGMRLWPLLTTGDSLSLVREPANPHDNNAIAVYRQTSQLGYIPRSDNTVLANLMDQGTVLEARISQTRPSRNPWERVRVKIMLMG